MLTERLTKARHSIFEIVDRVGGGDAFSSGLIYALMQNDWKHEDIVNFAVASSVMNTLSAAILTSQALTRLNDL